MMTHVKSWCTMLMMRMMEASKRKNFWGCGHLQLEVYQHRTFVKMLSLENALGLIFGSVVDGTHMLYDGEKNKDG